MKKILFLTTCITAFLCANPGRAQVIALHEGANDPTSEDVTTWSVDGSDVTVGPVTDDLGTGLDAWMINDDSNTGELSYLYFLSPEETTSLQTEAWTFSVRLRVVNVPDGLDSGISVRITDGQERWQASFGSEADGDPRVALLDENTSTIDIGTFDEYGPGYHLYEWKRAAGGGTVDFYVDGEEVYSDWTGFEYALGYCGWGSGSRAATGNANYNLVKLEIGGTEPLAGDLNDDGFVGGDDLDIVRSFWGQSVTPGDLLQGDPSNDGFVGGDDLDIVRGNWGQGTPPAPTAVPEPATLAGMLAILAAGIISRRRS